MAFRLGFGEPVRPLFRWLFAMAVAIALAAFVDAWQRWEVWAALGTLVALVVALKDALARERDRAFARHMLAIRITPGFAIVKLRIASILETANVGVDRVEAFTAHEQSLSAAIKSIPRDLLSAGFADRQTAIGHGVAARLARAHGLLQAAEEFVLQINEGGLADDARRLAIVSMWAMLEDARSHVSVAQNLTQDVSGIRGKAPWMGETSGETIKAFLRAEEQRLKGQG